MPGKSLYSLLRSLTNSPSFWYVLLLVLALLLALVVWYYSEAQIAKIKFGQAEGRQFDLSSSAPGMAENEILLQSKIPYL